MPLKFNIFRCFFIVFGILQTSFNLYYLLKVNGLALARKQHQELPTTATNKQIRVKVISMLSFGIIFLIISLISIFMDSFQESVFTITLGIFTVYILLEALYYRFWRTTGALIVSTIVFIISLL